MDEPIKEIGSDSAMDKESNACFVASTGRTVDLQENLWSRNAAWSKLVFNEGGHIIQHAAVELHIAGVPWFTVNMCKTTLQKRRS